MRSLLILVVAALLSACSGGSAPTSKGEAYFKGYGCVKCHQIGDMGHAWGPDLTMIGFRKSPEWLDLWLKDPHAWKKQTVMPNFNLPDSTRAELVKFLSEQKGQAWEKSGRPWNHPDLKDSVAKGEVLFTRAGCIGCHGQKGAGGFPNNNVIGGQIPSLSKVFEGYTKEELLHKIEGGVISDPEDPSQPKPMIFMPKWGDQLSKQELNYVVDYLFSLAPKKKAGKASSSDW
jgi:mono/diheme cytochrome c family protein